MNLKTTVALYTIHSKAALKQAESFAHIKNTVRYDSDETSYLSLIRHEALYAAFVLSKDFNHIDTTKIIKLDKLQDLQENIELYNTPNACVEFDNNYFSVGICLFNKWCGFNTIVINCLINKKNNNFVSDQIYKYFNSDSELYYKNLNNLEKNLFFYISVTNVHPPTINIGQMSSVVDAETQLLFDKIPKNVDLGYLVNQALIDRCLIKLDETNNTLNSLYRSGSRFSDKQLSRSCINIGFCADAKNLVAADPINTNLLRGLSEKEFFSSSSGTRKGIHDKSKSTPESGYIERSLVMALSIIEISEDDCGTVSSLKVRVISKNHIMTLIGKYFKKFESDVDWLLLEKEDQIEAGDLIFVRSPIFCKTPDKKICKKCFGIRSFNTSYLGILSGQILSERL